MKQLKKIKYFSTKKKLLSNIFGTFKKPRLSVTKSHKHIYAQLIDDENHSTLCFSSSIKKNIFSEFLKPKKISKNSAFLVGKDIGNQAKLKGITKVVFDRGHNLYHGIIESFANGAKLEGLIF